MNPRSSGPGEGRRGRRGGRGRSQRGGPSSPNAEEVVVDHPNFPFRMTITASTDEMPRALETLKASLALVQSNTPNPKSKKRSPSDDSFSPRKRKMGNEVEIINPKVCGNCGGLNHKAAFCVKTGRSGWMEACPKCDSTKHMYELCPQRNKGSEDFTYLIVNRERKPPVKSTMVLGNVIKAELERVGSLWHPWSTLDLPYSSKFAREESRRNPPKSYAYAHVSHFSEAQGRIPEPAKQSWSNKEEEFDPKQDSPILDQRLFKESPSRPADRYNPDITYSPYHTSRRLHAKTALNYVILLANTNKIALHCKGCGWNIDDIEVNIHECQFYKVWGGMSEVGGPTIELQCRNVKGHHQLKHRDLVAIRAVVLMEIDAIVAATGGPIDKWPVECPDCRQITADIPRE
ncbi:hypothetical protein GQX73_g4525 [Xylaria multiplex]|uniref:Uncharacterized protein n=1 Tax=Xylaria multiplex TaxID=323545 RepID=A0A7C8MQP9_9PEZI|nr:hypothetical protein GQX73_g4525 [Xylaria multiplex]